MALGSPPPDSWTRDPGGGGKITNTGYSGRPYQETAMGYAGAHRPMSMSNPIQSYNPFNIEAVRVGRPGESAGMPRGDFGRAISAADAQVDPYRQAAGDYALNQIANTEAAYGMNSRYAQEDLNNSLAMLGLDRQGLGVQRGALNDRSAYLDQMLGFANRNLALQMAGFDTDQKASGEQKQQETWQHRSDLTGRGGMHTPFRAIGQGWIDQAAQNRDTRISQGRQGAQLGFEKETASIADQRRANSRARQELGIQSQRLGVQESQLRTGLQRTLESLGLERMMSVNDIMNGLNSQNGQFYQDVLTRAESAIATGNIPPPPNTGYSPQSGGSSGSRATGTRSDLRVR